MRDKTHNGSGFFEPGSQLGNHRQRLDTVAVQIHDDQRRFFIAFLAFLFVEFLFAFDELDFHVQLARHFLDLGQKEEVVDQAEDSGRRVFALFEWFKVVAALQTVVETAALVAAVLAVAVVHGTDEGCSPARSEEHTSELQSPCNLVCRLLLEKKKKKIKYYMIKKKKNKKDREVN